MTPTQPTALDCPACGAPLEADGTRALVRCKFCGNVSLIPGILPAQAPGATAALDEIRQSVARGNLTEAIERYRQAYGVDLQEARNAIEALRVGRLATIAAAGLHTPEELTKALVEVRRLLAQGDKIGAVKLYREYYDVSLTRAKYAIEQIAAGQTVSPEAGFRPVVVPTQAVRAGPTGKWLACGITLAVLLLVGGIILFAMFQPGSPLSRHYYPNKPAVLVPAGPGAAPDIAALFYDPNKDARFIGLVNGTTGKLGWQAANLAGDGLANAILPGGDLVYAASADDLMAYQKSDGSLAWQAKMPDRLNYGTSTMLVTAGRVITNNADQSLQAYDARTGALVWSKRLSGYDRSLRLMGNSLVLIDYIDKNYHYGLVLLDPATGGEQKVLTPTCTSNDYTSNMDMDAGLVYDQAENAIFLAYETPYGCVQRLDLANGQTSWSATSKDNFSFVPDGFQYVLTDSSLFFSNGNTLMVVDKSSGKMKTLLTNPDYDLMPLVVAKDKLIVRARRTRGTERFELWGVDAGSGHQAWTMDMQGASPIDPPDEMAGLIDDTDWGWTWKLTSAGLAIIKFQGKPNQLILETFNPAGGTSLGKQSLPLKKVSGDFYSIPTVIGWQGDIAYLSLESNLYTLDVTGGTLRLVY